MSKAVLEREKTADRAKSANLDIAARNAQGITAGPTEEVGPKEPIQEPDHEEIALLAYALWEQGGFRDASAEENWFRAEDMLRSKYSSGRA